MDEEELRTRLFADLGCTSLCNQNGLVDEAHDLAYRAWKVASERWGEDDIHTLCCRRILGDQFLYEGAVSRAKVIFQKLADTMERLQPDPEPEELGAPALYTQIAQCLDGLGEFEEAVAVQNIMVDRSIDLYGDDPEKTINAKALLFQYYCYADRHREAIPIGERVFTQRRESEGESYRGTIIVANILAATYFTSGDTTRSLEKSLWLKTILLRLGEQMHPDNLESLQSTCNNLYKLKRQQEARLLCSSLVDFSKEILGVEHPQTQLRLQLLRTFDVWISINEHIRTGPSLIPTGLLDQLSEMWTKELRSQSIEEDPNIDDRFQTVVYKIRQSQSSGDPTKLYVSATPRKDLAVYQYAFFMNKAFMEMQATRKDNFHVIRGLEEDLDKFLRAQGTCHVEVEQAMQDEIASMATESNKESNATEAREVNFEWAKDNVAQRLAYGDDGPSKKNQGSRLRLTWRRAQIRTNEHGLRFCCSQVSPTWVFS